MAIENKEKQSVEEIFANPPAEYRGAPFWAWNTDLKEDVLLWQIDRLKEMGFGGFFMHTRSGMSTEYLGKEFMRLVRACNQRARKNGMLSYLYDEDRWPSGAAGGYVTQHKEFRQKMLVISRTAPEDMRRLHASDEREPEFLVVYDILFDAQGKIKTYAVVADNEKPNGEKWYAYMLLAEKSGIFNGYTYLDTMNATAVEKFIEVTHEAYKRELGDEFGKSVPAIFTDEPSYYTMTFKQYARDGKDVAYPWTQAFRSSFEQQYGYDIVARMPEVVWDKNDGTPHTARYHFFAHATELFAVNFSDKIGKWCNENGIAFTGHYMEEPWLLSQMRAIGEAMRHYRTFEIPGIDMLCNRKEFTTAKQAQSAAHQYGRNEMMSEEYGVTGWDYDFRGHKFQGDWQAALGVTLRVPHLSWVSMRGSAKRDYPASISYQSGWFTEYGYIEDHFARLNTALTRGKSMVNVAVLHPIESAWLIGGVREYTATDMETLDTQFVNITAWLLRGQIDFDFFSESLLPELYQKNQNGFCVGEMQYKAVLIPPIKTMRSTTLAALNEFADCGGKVLVCGDCPDCVDGILDNAAQSLWNKSKRVGFSQSEILDALGDEREISVFGGNGERRNDLIYNLRQDGENKWLFIAHCDDMTRMDGNDCAYDELRITVKGMFTPSLYNTLDGTIRQADYIHENGNTVIFAPCYPLDSFLYSLAPSKEKTEKRVPTTQTKKVAQQIAVPDFVSYVRSEPNALVLDMPEWSRDGERFMPREEILRIDRIVRSELGYPAADGCDVQPWRLSAIEPCEFVWLRYTIESETAVPCMLGYEYADSVRFNGKDIPVAKDGWYVDKEIYTMRLPSLVKGKNELLVRVPVSARISMENLFLLGDFGVETLGAHAKITALPSVITFDALRKQGMPFYGANVTYKIPFTCEAGDLTVTTDYYIGALVSARLDGNDVGKIVLPPYKLQIENVAKGEHMLELTLCGTRGNTFGTLHLTTPKDWKGPDMWYSGNNMWSYEYCLHDMGIMKKPELTLGK
ncbi:glycosyl hydrolase [Pumilibacter intestinalis]|uniref:glycosyl hydrolase n=1 Tax=Pumilibacter intestinalis TaxID=2941511 RepID=UPI00203CEC2A|nr:glycosyl hydrolase [Pumilibacter intestinalis]